MPSTMCDTDAISTSWVLNLLFIYIFVLTSLKEFLNHNTLADLALLFDVIVMKKKLINPIIELYIKDIQNYILRFRFRGFKLVGIMRDVTEH